MPTIISNKKENLFLKFIVSFLILILSVSIDPKSHGEPVINYKDDKAHSKVNFLTNINNSIVSGQDTGASDTKGESSDIEKAVIIIFDRGFKNQFTDAKPILDKYGFKASFFIICSFVDGAGHYKTSKLKEVKHDSPNAMSWDEVKQLYNEGHDIESHGMEHRNLKYTTQEEIEYEIAASKECLEDQGFKPTSFQIPSNKGAKNSTVLKIVSKYFDFGLSGHSRLMFLGCDGWEYGFKTRSYKYQTNCDPFSINDTHTHTNKYAIKEWSHDRFHTKLNNKYPNLGPHGDEISNMLFDEFVRLVEAQRQYNEKAGKIVAVPIIGFHKIDNSSKYDTSIKLFDKEMNYLYTNGFNVLTLTDLGYDEEANHFYIK